RPVLADEAQVCQGPEADTRGQGRPPKGTQTPEEESHDGQASQAPRAQAQCCSPPASEVARRGPEASSPQGAALRPEASSPEEGHRPEAPSAQAVPVGSEA